MDSYNSGPYGSGQYYCGGCGLLRPLMGKCPECVRREHMKHIEESMETQRAEAERARADRERSQYEAEREAYYERQRRREADPEYQAQKAFEREQERKQELAKQRQIEEARRREQERWNALSPQEQAAEIELDNKRQQLADAKLEFEREKHAHTQKKNDNFDFGLKSVLWVGYAGLLFWVFTSLLPEMFKSLTLLALPLGAMVLLLVALPGIYLIAFSAKD